MYRLKNRIWGVGAIVFLAATALMAQRATLHVGTAVTEITPPVGWRMAGNYYEHISDGVHDPLYAKTIVFQQGQTRAALLVADLCSVSRVVTDPARGQASRITGIPIENISICATHTHGSPEFYGVLRDHFHQTAIEEFGYDPHEPIDYQSKLVSSFVQVIKEAADKTRPVSLESTIAIQRDLAYNRRFLMEDGTVRFNPGRMDPKIVRAAGPVDEEVPIILFRDPFNDTGYASLTSFAMHVATFGGDEFGADFPGLLQKVMRERFGPQFVSVFGQGTSGDTNHFRFLTGKPDPSTAEVGEIFSSTVLSALPALKGEESVSLQARAVHVPLPLKDVTEAQIAWAQKVLRREWVPEPAFLVLVEAWRILNNRDLLLRDGPSLQAEIQGIRLSREVAVVTLPHEVFVEIGMDIKRRSPFSTTFVITMANDMDFYIPTAKAFAEGSYEVVTSPLKPGGGELLADGAVRLLEDLAEGL